MKGIHYKHVVAFLSLIHDFLPLSKFDTTHFSGPGQLCNVRPTCTANPIKENLPVHNMLVSYQAPCGNSSHFKSSFGSQSPMPVTTDAHRAWAVAVATDQS